MTCDTIQCLGALAVTVHAVVHGDAHQRSSRRAQRLRNGTVARLALELGDPRVSPMRVEDVVSETKQLVEVEGVSLGEQLGDTSGFSRLALRRLVTDSTGLGVRQSRMRAGAYVFMAELAIQPEIFRVLAVIELHRLGHSRTPSGQQRQDNHKDQHEGNRRHDETTEPTSAVVPVASSGVAK
jgi:hypothetical protein